MLTTYENVSICLPKTKHYNKWFNGRDIDDWLNTPMNEEPKKIESLMLIYGVVTMILEEEISFDIILHIQKSDLTMWELIWKLITEPLQIEIDPDPILPQANEYFSDLFRNPVLGDD